jgi:hypothetical protein
MRCRIGAAYQGVEADVQVRLGRSGNPRRVKEVVVLTLLRRYWSEMVSYEGGISLLYIDGLLLVPIIFAAFFYPIQVLVGVGAVLVVAIVVYECVALWRKHHPRTHPPQAQV